MGDEGFGMAEIYHRSRCLSGSATYVSARVAIANDRDCSRS